MRDIKWLEDKEWLIPVVIFAIPALLLLGHIYTYMPFIADDALISLRYAERLITGHGLTWTEGVPVEGYSNLLWVLIMAFCGLLGMDLVWAARIVGTLCMMLPLFMVAQTYGRTVQWSNVPPILIALFFYVLAAPIAVWAIGGLEQAMMVGLLGIAIPGTFRIVTSLQINKVDYYQTLLPLGLLCITRPDGPLFTVALAGTFLMAALLKQGFSNAKQAGVTLVIIIAIPLSFYAAQLIFRLAYYGEWVPNTALVKIAPSWGRAMLGWLYVKAGLVSLWPWVVVSGISAVGCLIWESASRFKIMLLLMLLFIWLGYVAFIGGDIFAAHRHVVPALIILLFISLEGLTAFWRKAGHFFSRVVLVVICVILLALFVKEQLADTENQNAKTERWEYEGQVLGTVLNKAFSAQQPLLAVTSAGCLPYWSKLPSLDMLGLNDYYLPRHPPENFGEGLIGHELGNGAYIMAQNPDIVIFNTGIPGPAFLSGIEMYEMPEFHEKYARILLRGEEPPEYAFAGYVWVNRYSEKIGIKKKEKNMEIPALFFNHNARHEVRLNRNNRLSLTIEAHMPAMIDLGENDYSGWHCQPSILENQGAICTVYRENNRSYVHVVPTVDEPGVIFEGAVLIAP